MTPLFAGITFWAIPAKLNPFFLDRTGDKGTAGSHPVFALAAQTPAFGLRIVPGAQPAAKPANSNLRIFDNHGFHLTFDLMFAAKTLNIYFHAFVEIPFALNSFIFSLLPVVPASAANTLEEALDTCKMKLPVNMLKNSI